MQGVGKQVQRMPKTNTKKLLLMSEDQGTAEVK